MLKHVGLSLCLCLMAMGLNSIFVTSSDAVQQPKQVTERVTHDLTAHPEQNGFTPTRHPARTVCGGFSDSSTQHDSLPNHAHRMGCSLRGRFFRH